MGKGSAVKVLYQDSSGSIWVGTWQGLYQLERVEARVTLRPLELGAPAAETVANTVRNILEDRKGALWIATDTGLYRRSPDGKVDRFSDENGLAGDKLMGLVEDRQGRLWAGSRREGLYRIVDNPDPSASIVLRSYSVRNGLACMTHITSLFQAADGRLWVGSDCGLSALVPDDAQGGQLLKMQLSSKELVDPRVWSLAEDSFGNLWAGTGDGAIRIARGGPVTYTDADGLGGRYVCGIFESPSGQLCVQTGQEGQGFVNVFDGERFTAVAPKLPSTNEDYHWRITQEREGGWWLTGDRGVWRYSAQCGASELPRLHPRLFGTPAPHGTRGSSVYEDKRGDIWISRAATGKLTRWERSADKSYVYSSKDGVPAFDSFATAYAEDHGGGLWIAFGSEGIVRYQDGHFRAFKAAGLIPPGAIEQLFVDSSGRLWIASAVGLARIDDPAAESIQPFTYTTASGLSSNKTWCVTEDQWGRIYVGTAAGLDRLDVSTGRIKHFTTADGLAYDQVSFAFRDRHGALWFGTDTGLSRLVPEPDRQQPQPAVFLSRLQISGIRFPISELGETTVRGLDLGASQNNIQIDFTGLAFGPGELLRFQYKLEGADAEWNPPVKQRTVNYASLSPGIYRFLVRAVNSDGVLSPEPASFDFTILRPIWQRWWFLTPSFLLLAMAIYSVHRFRLAQKLAVERVRTRIAADLHDDIGANLTRIAILSEVAQSQPNGAGAGGKLSSIADLSREAVASMSDIVWAINPQKDSLLNLIRRVRRFADDVLTARQIEFELRAPDSDVKLGADVRRNLFLVLKEAINNAVRHSGCSKLEIDIRIDRLWLELTVTDDGGGFDNSKPGEGQGVTSMEKRAASLGGEMELTSGAGVGTRISLKIPRRSLGDKAPV
jgi:ligand-binding sensor domain-containing protein/two-component sensor histidine kinase